MKIFRSIFMMAILATTSLAQAGSLERAEAIKAFDEGQKLIGSGDIPAACSKFQESYDLDSQLGSLLYLADCREQNGQFASAWTLFLTAAEWAQKEGDDRQEVAEERAAKLVSRVSYLQLSLQAQLPKEAVILRDGKSLSKPLWSRPIPLDAGSYTMEVSAPGYETWTGEAQVAGEGQTVELIVPALVPIAEEAAPVATVTPTHQTPEAPPRSLMARKWPAFVAAGVGVAGGVVWGVFGVQSMGAKSDADELCGEGFKCVDEDGTDLRDKAYKAGNVATIGVVITGVGLATAGVLWFVLPGAKKSESASVFDPTPTRPRFQMGVQPMGASLRGTF